MYDNGLGVPQSYKTAVKWYTLAAEQGDAFAQNNLGLMYDNGRGVPQDYALAVKWYTLAAEQGHAIAQKNLGVMYYNGEGVLQDYVYAHMWWNIAAANGNEDGGELRDFVAERMTPADISVAQRLARECVRKNYKGC
jgi:TPR repeat protein